MAKQGKCDNCKIAYRWKKEIKLSFFRCPECKGPLSATLHYLKKYPWQNRQPEQRIFKAGRHSITLSQIKALERRGLNAAAAGKALRGAIINLHQQE